MIKAELERADGGYVLRVSGHAGFAPQGEDIVCAAVSALVHGLYAYAGTLEKQGLVLTQTHAQLGPGEAEIGLYPEKQAADLGAGAFALAEEMLRLLGKHFPENIQFTLKNRKKENKQ